MKLLLFTFLVLFSEAVIGQANKVEYEITGPDNRTNAELIFNDSFSRFVVLHDDVAALGDDGLFWIDKMESKVYTNDRFMNVNFQIIDSLYPMNWNLTKDTTIILNEKCLAAETFFRGRKYIAYYAPRYNSSDGPWKFGGLPGLILLVKSSDNVFQWQAVKIIENYTGEVKPFKPGNHRYLAWDDFVEKYKSTVAKFIKLSRSNGTNSNDATLKIKISSVEIFYPELQTGQGIKF
jgi:hypothetical protein